MTLATADWSTATKISTSATYALFTCAAPAQRCAMCIWILNARYFARYYSTPSVGAVVPRIVNIDGSSLVTLSGANFAPGTHGVLTGYSRGTHGVRTGYARGTHGVRTGYSRGTHGVLTGYGQHCGEPAKAARVLSVRVHSQ